MLAVTTLPCRSIRTTEQLYSQQQVGEKPVEGGSQPIERLEKHTTYYQHTLTKCSPQQCWVLDPDWSTTLEGSAFVLNFKWNASSIWTVSTSTCCKYTGKINSRNNCQLNVSVATQKQYPQGDTIRLLWIWLSRLNPITLQTEVTCIQSLLVTKRNKQ